MGNINDYKCPQCRRVRRRDSKADALTFRCSCVGGKIVCPRVKWELADWDFLNEPLADQLGVGVHVVQKMRAKLKKPKGTEGRKPYPQVERRIDPAKIDPRKSVNENAAFLKCSATRIRQLLKELNQTTP